MPSTTKASLQQSNKVNVLFWTPVENEWLSGFRTLKKGIKNKGERKN